MNNSTSLTKKERIQKFGEVFTSVETVNQMLDMLPPETFKPERTFLEPCCGEGVFIIEILKRKFAIAASGNRNYVDDFELFDELFERNEYFKWFTVIGNIYDNPELLEE